MKEAAHRGVLQDGVLEGGLNVSRKAKTFYTNYLETKKVDYLQYAYALAIAEENASAGTIVTAPTCGASGVVPAVLYAEMVLNNVPVEKIKKEEYRLKQDILETDNKPNLTDEQKNAVDSILNSNGFKPYLLHGVTGSGKTEVYMRLIEDILNKNKTAILLVPEISLTPQLTEKFLRRFNDSIAILHSGLSNGEKYDEWRRIERGEVSIVIGARSAIFAPLSNLGIIIRTSLKEVKVAGRNTLGVRIIKLANGQNVSSLCVTESIDDENETETSEVKETNIVEENKVEDVIESNDQNNEKVEG